MSAHARRPGDVFATTKDRALSVGATPGSTIPTGRVWRCLPHDVMSRLTLPLTQYCRALEAGSEKPSRAGFSMYRFHAQRRRCSGRPL